VFYDKLPAVSLAAGFDGFVEHSVRGGAGVRRATAGFYCWRDAQERYHRLVLPHQPFDLF
jgi:hypothetical protein